MLYRLLLICLLLTACQSSPSPAETDTAAEPLPSLADSLPDGAVPESYSAPPPRLPDYDTTQWADIALLDSSILIDLKYATTDNFVQEQLYDCGRCFLRPAVAKAVVAAHLDLQARGLGLKMLDCYRPRPIQWKLWEKVPNPRYVSDPRQGSMHNRGAAVDLTLVDAQGQELDMGTPFDFFGPEASPAYTKLPPEVLANRQLLSQTMVAHGFKPITSEWWHFAYRRANFELSDMLWNCD
jgi:D-alanyl-D-alanine dipeptidase